MSVVAARLRLSRAVFAFPAILAALGWTSTARAQGVTTGAVRGIVTDRQGQPIAGGTVLAVNVASGGRYTGATDSDGRYFIANVIIGTYRLEARAIGFRPARREQQVSLGRVAGADFQLEASTVELTAIEVTGAVDAAEIRTGPATTVSRNFIENLPSINRNFTDFAAVNPLVFTTGGGTGVSVAGQSDRYNSLQIDGGTNSDLFGLNSSRGTPGGGNDSRPISVEAVQEYQVLIAPFDVRQGGFTGGLINAVTRSGTNQLHGSAFYYFQDQSIVGTDSAGNRASQFDLGFYGFSLGGPIVRDRLHFFVSGEWRDKQNPMGGLHIFTTDTTSGLDSAGIGIRYATADRVRQFAIANLGYDPGDVFRPDIPTPDQNLFAKLTAQVGAAGQAEVSFNRVRSSTDVHSRDATSANFTRLRDGYQLGNSGYSRNSRTNSLRARLNTPLGSRFTNELVLSYNFFEDDRPAGVERSLIVVGADRRATPTSNPTTFITLGGERFSHLNNLQQKTFELAENLTVNMGRHVLTLGGRMERFQFYNAFFPQSLGAWFFPDTTAFFAGTPTRYERNLPGFAFDPVNGRPDGPIADFTFSQFALYAQDQYSPRSGLTLTFGARVDFTGMPQPTYNPFVDTLDVRVGPRVGQDLGIRTDNRPTNAMLLSPRFGFNYDPAGDGAMVFRGGVGIFSGRTPYVWASNAYTNTGLEQVTLICDAANSTTGGAFDSIPAFTDNPAQQYTRCAGTVADTARVSLPAPSIVYFDKDFKLPQTMRVSLGAERRLPGNWTGSVEGLYTRMINNFILEDVNLVPGGIAFGEGNRQMYGTMSNTSSFSTVRRQTSNPASLGQTPVRDVLRQFNSNEDYSVALTFGLDKRFSEGLEVKAGYTWSRSMDLISPTSDISNSLMNFSTLDGVHGNRRLARSFFDVPHSIRVSGTATLPYGLRLSLFYTGMSGRPYSWRYSSDVNADGFNGNDLVYVPLNSSDILLSNPAQWPTLDAFINSEKCLREARGTIIRRTACRNPWRTFFDARATKSFPTMRGQNLELTASLFNVLSFMGVGGQIRETSSFETQTMMSLARYNTASGRGVYNLALPRELRPVSINASRWKLELGARYTW